MPTACEIQLGGRTAFPIFIGSSSSTTVVVVVVQYTPRSRLRSFWVELAQTLVQLRSATRDELA